MIKIECPRCKKQNCTKSGIVAGKQRYKCKDCNYHFSVIQRGKAFAYMRLAIIMYLEGRSYRSIGKVLGVSDVTVMKWINKLGDDIREIRSIPNKREKVRSTELIQFISTRESLVASEWLILGINDSNSVSYWIEKDSYKKIV